MNSKILLGILVFISFLLGAKFLFFPGNTEGQPGKEKSKKEGAFVLEGEIVQTSDYNARINISGSVFANEEAELRPEVSGKLIRLFLTEGAFVQKGSLLAKINDADLQAQYKKLELQLQLAREKSTRLQKLLAIQGVSKEEADAADIQAKTIEADIDFCKAQIFKTEIYAPFDGIIGFKNISEGAYVTNNTILATIQQTSLLKIDFSVPEKYADLVRKGSKIEFESDLSKEKLEAYITHIEPRIDMTTRTIKMRAIYKNAAAKLLPGSFVKISLFAQNKNASVFIPTHAIIPVMGGSKVFIVKDGKAKSTPVTTGIRNDTKIEISKGLMPGDTLLTNGIMSLREGSVVSKINLKP